MALPNDRQATSPCSRRGRLRVAVERGPDRRRVPSGFIADDRRSGFDRRRRYLFTGPLHANLPVLAAVLIVINVLSILDFVFTYEELRLGIAREANPLLAALFSQSPGQAWLLKSGTMLAVTWGIWRERGKRAVLGTAVFAVVAYLALTMYHIIGTFTTTA